MQKDSRTRNSLSGPFSFRNKIHSDLESGWYFHYRFHSLNFQRERVYVCTECMYYVCVCVCANVYICVYVTLFSHPPHSHSLSHSLFLPNSYSLSF